MVRVKGTVDKIWTNKTQSGKRYNVLEIDGGRYSLWDGEYFDTIKEGQEIEFEYKETGNFKNISRVYDGNGKEAEPGNGDGSALDNGNGYNGDRIDRMVRMSCIKSASNLFSGSKVPFEDRADKVVDIAKRFEEYIYDERVLDGEM